MPMRHVATLFARVFIFGAATFFVPATVANAGDTAADTTADTTSEHDVGDTRASLRDALANFAGQESSPSNVSAQAQLLLARIARFYDSRDFEPAWSGGDEANDNARHLLLMLQHAGEQGLSVRDYVEGLSRWATHPPTPGADAALFEIAFTGALFRYASDVRNGRFPPGAVYRDVRLPPRDDFDPGEDLRHALRRGSLDSYFAALPPADQTYQGLVAALARYRAIARAGGWPHVTATNRSNLAKRLALEDPQFSAANAPAAADTTAALFRYQARNGFTQEDVIRPDVLASLNQPVSFRIAQIVANLERRRWLPDRRESSYIEVNVPSQSLDYVHDGQVLLHSRVIIGKPSTPSPILRTEATAVVANPPWNVPDFIAGKTILPHLKRDPNYLSSHKLVLADGPADDPHGTRIDWSKVTEQTIPYQIQQQPGADNAMGILMLDAPNDFDSYLHDTPNKKFFADAVRTRSNGCIRVEQMIPLASLALTNDASQGMDEINTAIATGGTQRLALNPPLPIYMLYWTAIPYADGSIGFRPDRYGRDRTLVAMLAPGNDVQTSSADNTNKSPAVSATPKARPHAKPARPNAGSGEVISGAQ